MGSFWMDEERFMMKALIVSLLMHGVFFILITKRSTVQSAHYSVQPAYESIEVSYKEIQNSFTAGTEEITMKDLAKKKEVETSKSNSHEGVKTEASPNYFHNPPPPYPELAKQMRQEGLVVLNVDVDKEGVPIVVEIKRSSGYRLLDQAALKAVSRWKFQPGKVGDLSVESRVDVPVRFRLEEGNANSIRN